MTAHDAVTRRGSVALAIVALIVAAACGNDTTDTATPTAAGASQPSARITLDPTNVAPATASDGLGAPDTTPRSSASGDSPIDATTAIPPPTAIPSPSTSTRSTSTTPTTSTTTSTSTTTWTSTTTSTVAPTPVGTGTCVDSLSIRARAALVVWPSVYSTDWPGAIETVRSTGIGGVLLMRPSGWTRDDLAARLDDLEAASRHGLIVTTDEEGGDVQRLRFIRPLPSQREISASLTPEQARATIAEHGAVVRGVGVDMVLGPVVDVEPNVGEVPLQPSRFFVGTPDAVSAYGAAYVRGWRDADLLPVLKHYPGHGAASGDTHIEPGVTPSFEDIAAWDLAPYRSLAELAATDPLAVMVGHLTVPGLTEGVPATRSRAAVDHLRTDLAYGDALLITDALGMAAVGIPEPEAAVLALEAGIDIVIFTLTNQTNAVIDAIEAAVASGRIPEAQLTASAAKVMGLLERDGHTCDTPV